MGKLTISKFFNQLRDVLISDQRLLSSAEHGISNESVLMEKIVVKVVEILR